ncbi:hypothetical protein N0V82_007824 [Gnomoniopsis sp. IMI 355080]|nr:hypothetical protein N0V82_007824 [Gnomoniopsis sp. IMI 355080]
MPSNTASSDLSTGVSKLSLQTPSTKKSVKSKKEEVVDSWEEEDISSGSDTETETETETDKGHSQGTSAPPPTPISPTQYDRDPSNSYRTVSDSPSSSARPEKTDAVARRMIAGALGLKAPKLTEEQKAYQAAVKEKERKRREEQKAAEKAKEEEAAKARAAIWDD